MKSKFLYAALATTLVLSACGGATPAEDGEAATEEAAAETGYAAWCDSSYRATASTILQEEPAGSYVHYFQAGSGEPYEYVEGDEDNAELVVCVAEGIPVGTMKNCEYEGEDGYPNFLDFNPTQFMFYLIDAETGSKLSGMGSADVDMECPADWDFGDQDTMRTHPDYTEALEDFLVDYVQ